MKRALLGVATALVLAGCGTLPVIPAGTTSTATVVTTQPAPVVANPVAVTVARVIDGDTVVLSNGATVRLLGIDTPERGQCGYAEATWNARQLVGIKPVTLSGGSKVDRYGRWLRFITTSEGKDFGLAQIEGGFANARYDSRDGYGRHAKQDAYVAADKATAHMCAK